ncbi:hypothetical protein A8938_2330 [Algoriphagus zhangzhouensis]|uniref:Uncharacterized protein n=1 Tax=Algoriphagus zhangzhouensis TaxID=1073327 RepID=A0A1M7ZD36_9BACT|nr:hypothetical protein A8938_2330 [Algoriphagus zhangzhouensis]SHO62808.1 hypothetical protein SAMN04488108_2328 [Algoriphagus zhangzhouensis]
MFDILEIGDFEIRLPPVLVIIEIAGDHELQIQKKESVVTKTLSGESWR